MKLGFGTWRFFLAFLVVISHLWSGMIGGPAAYAVWGFYVLSGFLMTHVLRNKYGFRSDGLRSFAYNRFLRIFPLYWIACICGAFTILLAPGFGVLPTALNPQFALPEGALNWIVNVTLLPVSGGGLFVPVGGALAVEVGVYILMPLVAFSRSTAWLGLILSIALNVRYGFNSDTFAIRYSDFFTCFSVFALGSLASHYRDELERFKSAKLSLLIWLLHSVAGVWHGLWPWSFGIYISAVLSAWVVLSLASEKSGHIDKLLGDLSYPVYLFHTAIGVWVLIITNSEGRTFGFFSISLLSTLLVSWLVVITVDRRIGQLKINVPQAKTAVHYTAGNPSTNRSI